MSEKKMKGKRRNEKHGQITIKDSIYYYKNFNCDFHVRNNEKPLPVIVEQNAHDVDNNAHDVDNSAHEELETRMT